MKTKKTIAIVGATGSMGSAISKALAKGSDRYEGVEKSVTAQ